MTDSEIAILSKFEVAKLFRQAEERRLAGDPIMEDFRVILSSIVLHHGYRIADALTERE